jgi:UDP-N-acetylglucosamine 2-epimerase (non-hydrolysing)
MKNNIKYYFMIGTKAELIKLIPVIKAFGDSSTVFRIIASGQNSIDKDLDLLKIANIKKLDIVLSCQKIKQTPLGLVVWLIKTFIIGIIEFYKEFGLPIRKREIYLVVHGDTVTTFLGAVLAKLFGIKVVHVEAGLRSFNYLNPFPEEITRVIVSNLADIHFCPNKWALNNLKNKGGEKIDTFYNTSVETLNMVLPIPKVSPLLLKLSDQPFFIFLLHRNEHLFNKKLFRELVNIAIAQSKNMMCLCIIHGPTMVALKDLGIYNSILQNRNIYPVERIPYIEFMKTLELCEFIITDGGSTQEEATFLGKPCLLIRSYTERIEGLGENVVLSKNNAKIISDFIVNYKKYTRSKVIFNKKPSCVIYDRLVA